MKKFFPLFFILVHLSLFAQNLNIEARESSRHTEIPGACSDRTCVNLKDGNGTLGQIYAMSACGLNYVQVSRKVTTRYGTPAGSGLPVTLNVSGIPACFQIEQAYLWWTFAGTQNTSTATVTNPGGATQTFNATLSGSGPAKCWGEGGTRLFRADVTSHITGNGNYNVNLNTSVWGTDGITLFIIYRDLSATYTGNIYINDGLRVQGGGSQTQTLNFPAACQAGTNGIAFSIVSDMQDNVGATHQATHNGINGAFPSNFYNFDQTNVTINSGQSTSNFGYNKGSDCWAWSMMGLYFQTNCVTCTPLSGTPAVASVSQTNICSGQSVTASLNPVPAGIQWQSAPGSTGPWTNIAGATSSTYNSGPLTNNICYRAFYPSPCGTDTSNIVCVTIVGLSTAPTGATASPNIICSAQPVTLTVQGGSLAAGATWEWYSGSCGGTPVGSGATITVSPSTTTTYFVRAEGTCNTTACASVTVTIANTPTVQFSNSTSCFPNPTLFTDNSIANSTGGITSWSWNFGDGNSSTVQNPTHTYTNAGTYNVTLVVTNSNNCQDSTTQTVTVFENPVADFTTTNQCLGNTNIFNNISSVNAPSVLSSFLWDFGNGNTSTIQNPSHIYINSGVYNVSLIVGTNNNCYDTIIKPVRVHANPSAGFSYSDVCFGNAMNFTDTSSIAPTDTIVSYLWAFGDGSPTNSNQNVSHTYNNPGAYTVTLIATGTGGCSDVQTHTVNVYDAPQANFTTSNVCLNTAATFTNTTPNPQHGSMGNFSWNFGDGSPLDNSNWNTTHQYTTHGTYQVSLITQNANLGCADTITLPIVIHPMPVPDFTFVDQCQVDAYTFTNTSSIVQGSISSYNWNFGDNTTSTNTSPTHNYNSPGTYNVTLTATSDSGCVVSVVKQVTVYPMPQANFTTTEVCHNTATEFTSTSTVLPPDVITTYQWAFGDNNTSALQNPQNTYNAPGLYNATLIVTTNHNCRDTITLPVIVNPNPVVDFTAENLAGCTPHCTNFTSLSTILSGNIASYEWNFGNGNISNSQNPSHCFINESLSPKYFNITLKATSDNGCVTTLTKSSYITAYPLPIADFSSDPNPTDLFKPTVQFTDLSLGASSWLWNFGDNTFNPDTIIQNPVHTYNDSGIYNVWLYIENIYGCSDSISKPVNIRPNFALFIPNAFTPNGDSYNSTFAAKGFGIKEYTMYVFNRWGELIYIANDIDKGWDGTLNGVECQQDVYVYRIDVVDINLKKHQYRGTVSLIR